MHRFARTGGCFLTRSNFWRPLATPSSRPISTASSYLPSPLNRVDQSTCLSPISLASHRHHRNTRPVLRGFNTVSKMSLNGEGRQKRKSSPILAPDRPSKHLKRDTKYPNGTMFPDHGNDDASSDIDLEEIIGQPTTITADTAEWQATIEKVVRNVVSIHFCQTCSFDTDSAISSEATGFVVDAKQGYILTNRHVVGAGPFWGYCIFDNHEEVG